MVFSATMGHMSESPKYGMLMVQVSFLSQIVLDHFIITVAPEWVKMTSKKRKENERVQSHKCDIVFKTSGCSYDLVQSFNCEAMSNFRNKRLIDFDRF